MMDGEDPQELHRRLSALEVKLIDLGSDGFVAWKTKNFLRMNTN
jgi:hypothetical protein